MPHTLEQQLLLYAFCVGKNAGTTNERGIAVYSDRDHPARQTAAPLPAGLIYVEVDVKSQRVHVAAIDPLTDLADQVLAGVIHNRGGKISPFVRAYHPSQAPTPDPCPDFPPGKKFRRPAYYNHWEKRLMTLSYILLPPLNPFGASPLPTLKLTEDYRI